MIDLYRLYKFRYRSTVYVVIYTVPVQSMQIRLNPIEFYQIKSLSTKYHSIQFRSTKHNSINLLHLQHSCRLLAIDIYLSNFDKRITMPITNSIPAQQLYTTQIFIFAKVRNSPKYSRICPEHLHGYSRKMNAIVHHSQKYIFSVENFSTHKRL